MQRFTVNEQVLTVPQSIVVQPLFLSAEPIANRYVAVTTQGTVDFANVVVTLNNAVSSPGIHADHLLTKSY